MVGLKYFISQIFSCVFFLLSFDLNPTRLLKTKKSHLATNISTASYSFIRGLYKREHYWYENKRKYRNEMCGFSQKFVYVWKVCKIMKIIIKLRTKIKKIFILMNENLNEQQNNRIRTYNCAVKWINLSDRSFGCLDGMDGWLDIWMVGSLVGWSFVLRVNEWMFVYIKQYFCVLYSFGDGRVVFLFVFGTNNIIQQYYHHYYDELHYY